MSTDLYGIRILSKTNKELVVNVIGIYYDENICELPGEKSNNFFIEAFRQAKGYVYSKGEPVEEDLVEIPKNQIDAEFIDDDEEPFDGNYIEKIEITDEKNYPIQRHTNYSDFYGYDVKNNVWRDEKNLVQRTYQINVINNKFIKMLNPKMIWGTTAWEID